MYNLQSLYLLTWSLTLVRCLVICDGSVNVCVGSEHGINIHGNAVNSTLRTLT